MITFNPSRFSLFFWCVVESVEDCRRRRRERGGQTREIGNLRFRRVQKFEFCAANEITWWILKSWEIPMNSPLTKANFKTCCVFCLKMVDPKSLAISSRRRDWDSLKSDFSIIQELSLIIGERCCFAINESQIALTGAVRYRGVRNPRI